jgi:Tfp pilus assembly protein PilO
VRLWWVWAAPAALLAANLVWLLGVRGALGRGAQLVRQRDASAARVAELTRQRTALTGASAALAALESDLGTLRQERLGSMRERLVAFLVDVNRRTSAAGLRPDRVAYTAEADKKTGLVHFSAIFVVSGTYEEVRRCVSLLESSPQFVVVERLAVRSEDGIDSLAVEVQLTVGTYFVDADTGMLRQLGIEELPRPAAGEGTPPRGAGAAAAAEGAAAVSTAPPTDFSDVDARVLEDLRAAAAGLADGESDADADVFMPPAAEAAPRRDRGRPANERRSRSDAFMAQVGRREVSRGR